MTKAKDSKPKKPPGRVRTVFRHMGMQGSRVILLACIVGLSAIAVGFAAAYPLRYVQYESNGAVQLDQTALAGEIDVNASLVSANDLSASWSDGDSSLAAFGVLGSAVCGKTIDLPTPLSAEESAVFRNEADGTSLISQALRVEKSRSAVQYVNDIRDELEECGTFYQDVEGERVKITSDVLDREPPLTDHVTRVYSSTSGVQEWSMMAIGDVIIAIQYLGPTTPAPTFLSDVELSVLGRIDQEDFAPLGIGVGDEVDAPTAGAPDGGAPADESGAVDPGP